MTELKSLKDVWNEHRKDTPITWVLMVIVFFLAATTFNLFGELLGNIVFAFVAGTVLITACLYLQRWS
jgi:uncharacterized membrane protein YjjP (DUF1212 family)